jgi:hypothetical protein
MTQFATLLSYSECIYQVHHNKYNVDIFGYNDAINRSVKNHTINLVEKVLQLSVKCQLNVLDNISIPMLTYASEIWRYENIDILEKKHIKHSVSYCLI